MPSPFSPATVNGHSGPSYWRKTNGHADRLSEGTTSASGGNEDMELEDDYDSEGEDRADETVVVHVEVRVRQNSRFLGTHAKRLIRQTLEERETGLTTSAVLVPDRWKDGPLEHEVEMIYVAESEPPLPVVQLVKAELRIHPYQVSYNMVPENMFTSIEDEDESANKVSSANITDLPAKTLEGTWQNLLYEDDLKGRLMRYIYAALTLSDAEVDSNVVSFNRMVLLHGPPGTGKTSLCRALAQKIAIRLSGRYQSGRLVEISSHSLFSRWFSESGKLVQALFQDIMDIAEDSGVFVVVMIDEVESLTAARAASMSGCEPTDGMRVVNALLTQLDRLKTRKNVLVMTTSNISGAIDPAFIDRADIKEYVGLPPPQAVYFILASCLQELMTKRLVREVKIQDWYNTNASRAKQAAGEELGRTQKASLRLSNIAQTCYDHQLSGRFLRRLPMLALARYMSTQYAAEDEQRPQSIERWLSAMENVVEDEKRANDLVEAGAGRRLVDPVREAENPDVLRE